MCRERFPFGATRKMIMVKLIYCITKKPGMDDEKFFQYWKNVHGPIGARIPGLRKLVQSHRVKAAGDKRRPDYDGVAELWFDDMQALLASRQSPEWKQSTDDEANFVNHTKVAYLVCEEHIILDKMAEKEGPRSGLKRGSA